MVAVEKLASELLAHDGDAIASVVASETLKEVMCGEEAVP
jgi:hypothetical protein